MSKIDCFPQRIPINCLLYADIDECSDQTNDCTENSICVNTRGSYECRCKPGYDSIGSLCERNNKVLTQILIFSN